MYVYTRHTVYFNAKLGFRSLNLGIAQSDLTYAVSVVGDTHTILSKKLHFYKFTYIHLIHNTE